MVYKKHNKNLEGTEVKKILVIIPNFGGVSSELIRALTRLSQSRLIDTHLTVLIVDYGTDMEELKKLKNDFSKTLDLKIWQTKDDLGGTGSYWLGMLYSLREGYDYVLLHDNDAYVEENTIHELIKAAEKYEMRAVVGPCILVEGTETIQECAGGRLRIEEKSKELIIEHLGIGKTFNDIVKEIALEKPNLSWFTFCMSLIPCTIIKDCGLPFKSMFLSVDDIEYGYRVYMNGYKIIPEPQVRAYHKFGVAKKRTPRRMYFDTRNTIIFLWLVLTNYGKDPSNIISHLRTLLPEWKLSKYFISSKFIFSEDSYLISKAALLGILNGLEGKLGKRYKEEEANNFLSINEMYSLEMRERGITVEKLSEILRDYKYIIVSSSLVSHILSRNLDFKLRKRILNIHAANRKTLLCIIFHGLIGNVVWLDTDGVLSFPFVDIITLRITSEKSFDIEVYKPSNLLIRVLSGLLFIMLRMASKIAYYQILRKIRRDYMKILGNIIKRFNCDVDVKDTDPTNYILLEV